MLKTGQVSSCGHCSLTSKGEFIIAQLLKENNIIFEHDKTFAELKNYYSEKEGKMPELLAGHKKSHYNLYQNQLKFRQVI